MVKTLPTDGTNAMNQLSKRNNGLTDKKENEVLNMPKTENKKQTQYEELIEQADWFHREVNKGLVEQEQIIDGFEILLEKIEDLSTGNHEMIKVTNLLSVLLLSFKSCNATDFDLAKMFEQSLSKQKELTSPASQK